MSSGSPLQVGVVVIGRNEGDRLERCLQSVVGRADHVVYVDSGSTDGSVKKARSLGADVVELDARTPFTMARARNAGFRRLMETGPCIGLVQFVDGDCEVVAGWIERATLELIKRPELVAVCGRRRERFPRSSVYNRLIDMEWDTPLGLVSSCGGDVMLRTEALSGVGGFNESMIAGEEPELCFRLRQAGGIILRIDADMTLHDAAMTRFRQWWLRAVRAGYAYGEGVALHWRSPERYKLKQAFSAVVWGFLVPLLALGSLVFGMATSPALGLGAALVVAAYAILLVRIVRRMRASGRNAGEARLYACFTVLAKLPQFAGILRYMATRALGVKRTLIEYKASASAIRPN